MGGHGMGASSSLPAPPGSSTPTALASLGGGSAAPITLDGPGSSVPADSAPPLVPPPLQRPSTRLQQGIRKPKVYTDGTIRYGQLAATSEGPPNLRDALSDKNWKHAMDVEFDALRKK